MNLKNKSTQELKELAETIRAKIIHTCMSNGGHLGASLGSVELSLVVHKYFNSPKDKIIWDVGHQAYAHKIITGREKEFKTIRLDDGLAPFLNREESKHDIFGAGHSSTSISAALGVSYKNKNWTIAIIGDGALTAGISFEALNNISTKNNFGPLLIILNDNQLSISENVGAIPNILNKNAKKYFNLFGLEYIGIIDGHSIEDLEKNIQKIKNYKNKKIILHLKTQKGKGYRPAEKNPIAFHGVSPPLNGIDKIEPKNKNKIDKKWSDLFSENIIQLADKNNKVIAITAAMSEGTGLVPFFKKFPDRSIDVGIAEQHAVTFSAGLAVNGKKPIIAIYSTFLQRAVDSMIHDVALQNLDVLFCADRAGIVGADGPTHHGVFDTSFVRMIPNFKLYFPETEEDFKPLFLKAFHEKGPKIIRYPRGNAEKRGVNLKENEIKNGFKCTNKNLKHFTKIIITIGPIGFKLEKILKSKKEFTHITQIHIFHISDQSLNLIKKIKEIHQNSKIYFYEEAILHGSVSEWIASKIEGEKIFRTIPSQFISHGSILKIENKLKWDENSIISELKKI